MLPSELHEWGEWTKRLSSGSFLYRSDFEKCACELSQATIDELGDFYEHAEKARHVDRLNHWFGSTHGMPADNDELAVRNLLHLFNQLAKRGYSPFTKGAFGNIVGPTPDWSKLPPEMSFLSQPAMQCRKYIYVFSDITREQLKNQIAGKELELLASTAESIRQTGWKNVRAWYIKFGVSQNIEASLVFNLIAVLDALELKYYDAPAVVSRPMITPPPTMSGTG